MSRKHITPLRDTPECKRVGRLLKTILPNPLRWLEDGFGNGYFFTRIDYDRSVKRLEKQREINKQLTDKGYRIIDFDWIPTLAYLELFITFSADLPASEQEGGAE